MNILVSFCVIVLCSRNVVQGYNVDVNFPILYKGPDGAHFGYSLAVRAGAGSDNWLQVGAPKGENGRMPLVKGPGTVYRCPFKQRCRHLDIDINGNIGGERKDGSWLGGTMDVNTGTNTYAVCSHRRINEKWTNIYYMTGSCYWGLGENNLPRKLLPLENHETYSLPTSPGVKPIIVYDWGNGLAGASVHIPSFKRGRNQELQLVLGAPGVFNLRGAAILYKDLPYGATQPIVTNPYRTSAMTKDDDYVGYQVSSGYFFNTNKLLYVTSAPRASNYRGKVMIFEFPNRTREGMVVRQELVGDTFGEYFGASLASGDLDGDDLDDLVIGAPNWSMQEDEGRVYVYSGSNNDKLTQNSVFDGKYKGAMFGYSVQILGDLDRDGYNDLAVGSPYEDDGGALYIYYGGVNGLAEERSTRILASKLSPLLKGFGVSMSKAEDMDRNGYKDFAVGSFISGHAVLLRSRPVAEIMVSLEANVKNLDHEATKFQTNLCVIYLGHDVPENLNLVRVVSADVASGRVTLAGTGSFENEATVQVTKNAKSCETLQFDLKTKNNYDPLEITASYNLMNESNGSSALLYGDQIVPENDRFCSNCPVLRLGSRTRATITISFASNCGDDGECNSDLQVSGKFNGTTNGAYIIGSDASISLEVEVHNAGENAYLTQLHVQIPKPVDLESIPPTCQEDEADDKSMTLTCFVSNPLQNDTTKSVFLSLDMSKVGISEDGILSGSNSLQFNITATTISKNKNNGHTRLLRMNLKTEFDITVTGKTSQDTLSYDSPENGTVTDVLRFQHTFAVQKFGASPVHEALLTIMLPYSMQPRSGYNVNFLKIYSISGTQDGQPLQCSNEQISYQVDSEYSTDDFDFDSLENTNETFRGIAMAAHTRTTRQVTVDALPKNRTLYLNCDSHLISCYFVKCRVGPFIHAQTVSRLEIEMAANATALRELLGNYDLALFASAANVIVTRPDGLQQSPVGGMLLRPDDFVLSTLFIGSPKAGAIAIWIIALSVVVGLLLLSLLIAGLVKAGFFKRKTKEELEALKEAEQTPVDKSEEDALNGDEDHTDREEHSDKEEEITENI